MNTETLQAILQESTSHHSHLCPRQILGARLGLAGMSALGFDAPPAKKRLIVITECDGCFVDGLIAATACTVGHRTLRVEDFGKTAATFIDVQTKRSFRVSPARGVREKVYAYASRETNRYSAQLYAYQIMPDNEMFNITQVVLNRSIESIVSRPGMRVLCDACGEEIMNEREVKSGEMNLCLPCAGAVYYSTLSAFSQTISLEVKEAVSE